MNYENQHRCKYFNQDILISMAHPTDHIRRFITSKPVQNSFFYFCHNCFSVLSLTYALFLILKYHCFVHLKKKRSSVHTLMVVWYGTSLFRSLSTPKTERSKKCYSVVSSIIGLPLKNYPVFLLKSAFLLCATETVSTSFEVPHNSFSAICHLPEISHFHLNT